MQHSRIVAYAWGVLAFNVLVILWGAFVRISGAGAGCGSHWPTCNGEVIPQSPAAHTMIEFFHRLTSGLDLLLMIGLLVWTFRAFPPGHLARLGAVLSFAFIIVEALFGAGLVLFGLVAKNDSVARAVVLALHLVNTFLLLGSLTLTAWWMMGGRALRWRGQGGLGGALAAALIGVTLVGATGAVTALGDTLFPAGSLAEGIRQDLSPTAHFLVQLRVIHPVLAILVSGIVLFAGSLAQTVRPLPVVRRMARLLLVALAAQIAAGMINLVLLAPAAMQLIHLLLADLVWICLVMTTATALGEPSPAEERARALRPPLTAEPAPPGH